MACPKNGPCLFIDTLDLCCLGPSGALPDACVVEGQPVAQAIVDQAILAASELLWAATGRQFGQCAVVLRPCNGRENLCEDRCPDFSFRGFRAQYPWIPVRNADGAWINVSCTGGGCCDVCSIKLPYPVCSVDQVKINGEVLLENQYRVDGFSELVYLWKYGPEELEGVQMFTSIPGEYCTSPAPSSYQFGVENSPGCAPGGVYRKFGEGDVADPSSVLITYTGSISPLQGGFGFQHPTLGLYTWPTTLIPQALGETRKSDILIDGDGRGHYATVTYVSGPTNAGPAALNNNSNPQSLFWPVDNNVTPRVVKAEFFGPVQAGCWPACQNLLLEDTELDTFSVAVTYGRPVPELVKLAAAELACQLIKNCVGAPCSLPQRVTSITRQGVTMALLDPQDFLDKGRTGIWIVDQAIATFNPYKLMRPAAVFSPDAQPNWRRAGT